MCIEALIYDSIGEVVLRPRDVAELNIEAMKEALYFIKLSFHVRMLHFVLSVDLSHNELAI